MSHTYLKAAKVVQRPQAIGMVLTIPYRQKILFFMTPFQS